MPPGVASRMALRWAVLFTVAVIALACGAHSQSASDGRPDAHPKTGAEARQAVGLTPEAARVTILRHNRVRTLSAAETAQALALVADALSEAGPLVPVPDEPRFLANLRLNEHLIDITMGVPQALVIGPRSIPAVSGLVVPFTGNFRKRIIVLQEGGVEISGPLLASSDLVDLEWIVEKEDANP